MSLSSWQDVAAARWDGKAGRGRGGDREFV